MIAGFLIFASLAIGLTVAVKQTLDARRSEQLAQARFDDVRQLANNVVFKYHDAIADLPGSTEARKMLVTDALKYLDGLAKTSTDNPELQKELASAYLKMGDVQGKMYSANIGDTKGALESYGKSISLLEMAVVNRPKDVEAKDLLIKAYDSYAFLRLRFFNEESVKDVVEKAINLCEEIAKTEPQNDKRTIQLIDLYVRLGDVDIGTTPDKYQNFTVRLNHHLKALPLAEKVYRSGEDKFENVKIFARVYQRLGTDHFWLGEEAEKNQNTVVSKRHYAQALEFHTKSFEMIRKMFELERESNVSRSFMIAGYANMAKSLSASGKYEKALEFAKKNLKLSQELREADAANKEGGFAVSIAYEIFGDIYLQRDDCRKSIENFDKALAIDEMIYLADKDNLEILQRIPVHFRKLAVCYASLGEEKKARVYEEKQKEYKDVIAKSVVNNRSG